jgi:DNA replication protein DnaC
MSIEKKKRLAREKIISKYKGNYHDIRCVRALKLIDQMADSNIPAGYWFIKMSKFKGPKLLADIVDKYSEGIKDNYASGRSICLAGNQGTGKTMSSICILKAALKNGYTSYYITASDIMAEMTNYQDNRSIRKTLRDVDFLAIDELDSRFFPSDAQKELFSGIYENIFRHRAHNNLPTIICTNETDDILNVFSGPSVQSITSLNNQYLKVYPFAGIDYRKRINNES